MLNIIILNNYVMETQLIPYDSQKEDEYELRQIEELESDFFVINKNNN